MKTLEKNITSLKTESLRDCFPHPEEVLFFDIETTGFSPRGASVYLIGCAYFTTGGWRCRQYFAETPAKEAEILQAFTSFCASFSHFVHFNGTTFDIPFLQAKCKRHSLASFAPASHCDIYKRISPYKNMLHLPGCRQKQLEEFIGLFREDPFNGGQLIELYHAYGESRDQRLLEVLLLHNYEDLAGMLQLYSILAIPALFEQGEFTVEKALLQKAEDSDGVVCSEFLFRLSTKMPLPVPLSCHGSSGILKSCFVSGRDRQILIRLPVLEGELKYFYRDYKNYSYLPAEDAAIHKSVAVYVDKSQRMPATAATCYTRKSGRFLPCFGETVPDIPRFKKDYGEKQEWFAADESFLENEDLLKNYAAEVLAAFTKKPRN